LKFVTPNPAGSAGYGGAGRLHVYTAELVTHGGRSLHYLVAHDLAGLAAKLETAEAGEPGPV
jgi:hypothetical protein